MGRPELIDILNTISLRNAIGLYYNQKQERLSYYFNCNECAPKICKCTTNHEFKSILLYYTNNNLIKREDLFVCLY